MQLPNSEQNPSSDLPVGLASNSTSDSSKRRLEKLRLEKLHLELIEASKAIASFSDTFSGTVRDQSVISGKFSGTVRDRSVEQRGVACDGVWISVRRGSGKAATIFSPADLVYATKNWNNRDLRLKASDRPADGNCMDLLVSQPANDADRAQTAAEVLAGLDRDRLEALTRVFSALLKDTKPLDRDETDFLITQFRSIIAAPQQHTNRRLPRSTKTVRR